LTVLDASALLALIHEEPGADLVAEAMNGSVIGTPNFAEVIGKLVDARIDASAIRQLVVAAGVTIEPLTADDAELVGALRAITGGQQLSLGDRCCLALAIRSTPPIVMTADGVWANLDLPIEVRLIR
jgi:PIN domain nuclease of toxin-antitoxin system